MSTPAMHLTRAWSCTVRLVVDDPRVLRAATSDLTTLLASVDAAASRFRVDSDLSKANARAGLPTPIPKILTHLVAAALEAAADTDGLVDPTIGLQLAALGYDRDIREVEPDGPPVAVLPRRGNWRDVRLDRTTGLLTVPRGTALDLGATAKAYVADLAARSLRQRYGTAVLVELGGDLAVAGSRPGGWVIDVAEREGGSGQRVSVWRGGMATSTTTVRTWRRGGRAMSHLVDPRTGATVAPHWRTASVYAPSALAANVASTAALVLGADADSWLRRRRAAARLVATDGSVHTYGAWPVNTAPVHDLAAAS